LVSTTRTTSKKPVKGGRLIKSGSPSGDPINGPYDPIELPFSAQIDYEAELVVIVGQRCKHVSKERAAEVVWLLRRQRRVGARLQMQTAMVLGKSFDTHAGRPGWLPRTRLAIPIRWASDVSSWRTTRIPPRTRIQRVRSIAHQPRHDAGTRRPNLYRHPGGVAMRRRSGSRQATRCASR
jgi:hypothetical protein